MVNLVLAFSFYSLLGWAIETLFKSMKSGRFVNSGFLNGPFCPIYGFGALLVLQLVAITEQFLLPLNQTMLIIGNLLLAIVLTSVLEYFTGMFLEKMFAAKWWDYSTERFNLHGRVCLKYSIYWGVLAYVLLALIYPTITQFFNQVPMNTRQALAYILIAYFTVDWIFSMNDAYKLREHLSTQVNQHAWEKLVGRHRRLMAAFPHIYSNLIDQQVKGIRASLDRKWKQLRNADEFRICIADLIDRDAVQMMRQFRHHCHVNCYEHSLHVAYYSFLVCKALGWDYKAAARGGLLHDLFLYDWRTTKLIDGKHGLVHPRYALNNALAVSPLNAIEKDIILKHMFPLTWRIPRYKESLVVCLVDTHCTLTEIYYSVFRSQSLAGRYPDPKAMKNEDTFLEVMGNGPC